MQINFAPQLAVAQFGMEEGSSTPIPNREFGLVVNDTAEFRFFCSAARAVTLRSGPWDGGRVSADPAAMAWRGSVTERDGDGHIVAARMRFPEQCSYARVEVAGAAGGTAWSNPFAVPTDPGGDQSSY